MRIPPLLIACLLAPAGASHAAAPAGETSAAARFFERLDANRDGRITLAEAPEQGKMLVEFLLSQTGGKGAESLDRGEFMRLAAGLADRHAATKPPAEAVAAALGGDAVQAAPKNCPACAMGLTAEFVFQRLDVDEDKLVTAEEFTRSPGMQDLAKAREVVARLDKSGDGKLTWEELETAYKARHADCKKPDPAALAANVGPDGHGDGIRFAQVFILRSDQNGDGKVSQEEFRGPAAGFQRLDKNGNGFIEADELGDLHQRRLNDPKTMQQRLKDGDFPKGKPPAPQPKSSP